jgi:hypothetical protein
MMLAALVIIRLLPEGFSHYLRGARLAALLQRRPRRAASDERL